MGIELGRISGPLLARNLDRDTVDLAFETDLLYLSVVDPATPLKTIGVGVNTDAPNRPLTVNGTARTTNLLVPTLFETTNRFSISTNRIQNLNGAITISPDQSTDPKITTLKVGTANLRVSDGLIANITNNSDVVFDPTGRLVITTSMLDIDLDLHATGDITWDGTITFGSDSTDSVSFNSDVTSSIIPNDTSTYDLGTSLKRWKTTYTETFTASNVTTDTLTVNGIDMLLNQGNTIYVSVNGSDSNIGEHLRNTFRTIKHALSVATAGDEIVIFPGTYEEEFPLTVPVGVSIRGTSIRGVSIVPTVGTNNKDCFLLNGETTISFLTVQDFFYDSVNNTGYAFRFAPNFKVTTRSPYMYNITVITRGSVTSLSDPSGFNQGDAGRGALLDGSVATTDSYDTAGLFYSATFIVPNADGITVTNGARCEWLNSFTYFANRGIYLTQGTSGRQVSGSTTTYSLSNNDWTNPGTISSEGDHNQIHIVSNDVNPTALGVMTTTSVGTVFKVTYEDLTIDTLVQTLAWSQFGSVWNGTFSGFSSPTIKRIIQIKIVVGNGGIPVFGAEMRSINSANVYGNYGAVADGADTLGYLIGHNFGYVGTGANSLNDRQLVIQANEIVEINNGHLYYDSMDHKGDYRIGNIFYVEQDTGRVVFNAQSINFTANGSIILEGPSSTTIIEAAYIQTGNIRIYDNNIVSLFGPVNFLASNGTTNLNTDVTVTGKLTISGDALVKGNVYLGNTPFDTVTVFPKLTQNINPATTNMYTLGNISEPKTWKTAFATGIIVDATTDIRNNTITTLTTGTDLQLKAAGSGIVRVTNTDLQIDNNLTVTGLRATINGTSSLKDVSANGTIFLTGNIGQTGDTYIIGSSNNSNISILGTSSYFEVPDIKIQDNIISITAPDTNLNLVGNGSAGVILDQRLKFKDNAISNVWVSPTTDLEKSIIFKPDGTGNTTIDSVRSLVLPTGNQSTRNISSREIRYNGATNYIEGGLGTGLASFVDVSDTDRNTTVIADGINTLRFNINSVEKADINSTRLFSALYKVDNISFTSNTISNTLANTDLIFEPNGAGSTVLNNLDFGANLITNLTNGALVLASTGTGYVKFEGTGAIVIPTGDNSERRAEPDLGELRYNQELAYTEVWNGMLWIPAIGTSGEISAQDVEDILEVWTYILG